MHQKENSIPTTVKDEINSLHCDPSEAPIKTEEDANGFANAIAGYIVGPGQEFIAHYSNLSNILQEMDRLHNSGLFWNQILSGLADYLFRG